MTLADLEAAIAEVHQRATKLYLQRQSLEQQRQVIQQQASMNDLALVMTDGELEALERLRAKVMD
jgi:UDP-N-acetylmuramate-alanine ligase